MRNRKGIATAGGWRSRLPGVMAALLAAALFCAVGAVPAPAEAPAPAPLKLYSRAQAEAAPLDGTVAEQPATPLDSAARNFVTTTRADRAEQRRQGGPERQLDFDIGSVFLYQGIEGLYLGRLEPGLGDGVLGTTLSSRTAAPTRPSVTGDGLDVYFVSADLDLCSMPTLGDQPEVCLGLPGSFNSAAISPDGTFLAYVPVDQAFVALPQIRVVDLLGEFPTLVIDLPPVQVSGAVGATPVNPESLAFTSDASRLLYDARYLVTQADGTQSSTWGIFEADLVTLAILPVYDLTVGLSLIYPSLAHGNDNFLLFEAFTGGTDGLPVDQDYVFAIDRSTGTGGLVAQLTGGHAYPSFKGDDLSVLYSVPDPTVLTGASVYEQPLDATGLNPLGLPFLFLSDATYCVGYRLVDTFTDGVPQ